MLLYLHIALGISSLIGAGFAKARLTYVLLGGTLVSGLGLFIGNAASLGRVCLSGSLLTVGVLSLLKLRQYQLAKQAP